MKQVSHALHMIILCSLLVTWLLKSCLMQDLKCFHGFHAKNAYYLLLTLLYDQKVYWPVRNITHLGNSPDCWPAIFFVILILLVLFSYQVNLDLILIIMFIYWHLLSFEPPEFHTNISDNAHILTLFSLQLNNIITRR